MMPEKDLLTAVFEWLKVYLQKAFLRFCNIERKKKHTNPSLNRHGATIHALRKYISVCVPPYTHTHTCQCVRVSIIQVWMCGE